jgi:hypothetical protein
MIVFNLEYMHLLICLFVIFLCGIIVHSYVRRKSKYTREVVIDLYDKISTLETYVNNLSKVSSDCCGNLKDNINDLHNIIVEVRTNLINYINYITPRVK